MFILTEYLQNLSDIFYMKLFELFVFFYMMSHNGLQRIYCLKNYICLAGCENDIRMCSQYTVPPPLNPYGVFLMVIFHIHVYNLVQYKF